jgi:hypothetical protein
VATTMPTEAKVIVANAPTMVTHVIGSRARDDIVFATSAPSVAFTCSARKKGLHAGCMCLLLTRRVIRIRLLQGDPPYIWPKLS